MKQVKSYLLYAGDNKMNTQIRPIATPLILIISLSIISLTTSFGIQANASASTKIKDKVKVIKPVDIEMKCYVELMGGGEVISFTNTPYQNLHELTQLLIGQKVKLTSDDTARAIYKVKECVPLKDKFTSKRAQTLFLNTPR